MRLILTALALGLLLTAPSIVASDGEHTYSGLIVPSTVSSAVTGPLGTSSYANAPSHDFKVDVPAGETISATLTWYDAYTDLDLVLIAPGGSCSITASLTTVNCAVASVPARVACIDGNPGRGFLNFGSTESQSIVTAVGGVWTISVQSQFAPPGPVAYDLSFSISGAHGPVPAQPTYTNYVGANAACRVV